MCPLQSLFLEPYGKNTAAAIGLMVHILMAEGQGAEVMGVFPADHLISDEKAFLQAAKAAEKNRVGRSHRYLRHRTTLWLPRVMDIYI